MYFIFLSLKITISILLLPPAAYSLCNNEVVYVVFDFGPFGDMLGIGGDFKFRDLAGKFLPEGGEFKNKLNQGLDFASRYGVKIGF